MDPDTTRRIALALIDGGDAEDVGTFMSALLPQVRELDPDTLICTITGLSMALAYTSNVTPGHALAILGSTSPRHNEWLALRETIDDLLDEEAA